MVDKPKKVIVISGPTATGKTALGVELCLRLGGEVISADSMQVYRGLDIGTAKVTQAEARGVPHHMIDVAGPGEDFSVSRWVDMAAHCAEDIFSRGKIPVIVGGTGLYARGCRENTTSSAGTLSASGCAPWTRKGPKFSTPRTKSGLCAPWRYTCSRARR